MRACALLSDYLFLAALLVGVFFLEGADFFFIGAFIKGLAVLIGLFAGAAAGRCVSAGFFAGAFSVGAAVLAAGVGADGSAAVVAEAGLAATTNALGLRPRLAGAAG